MKMSYVLSLCLAGALAVPVVAQQQNQSNTQDQPQTQAQPQAQPTQAQPAAQQTDQAAQATDQTQAATGKEPLKYERHEGFWGKMNPFARKKYVNKQLDPVRGRVNELDELTAKNSKMIADVDSRATEGIRNAMSKANEADTHALDAGNRANQAQQTAQTAHTRITGVEQTVSKLDQYQPVTQAEIRFRSGQGALSQNAKEALDQIATSLKGQKGYIVEVQGFSPGAGTTAIENSRSMAQMVVRYLVLNHNVPLYRIYTVGMGNAPLQDEDGKMKRARGGRVEISLLKNSLADLSPAGGATNDSGAAAAAPANSTSQPPAGNQTQEQQQKPPQQ